MELKWSHNKSILNVSSFVCVVMMWSDSGQSLEESANFNLCEGLNIFGALSDRGSSLMHFYLLILLTLLLNLAIQLVQRFVIQVSYRISNMS